MEKLGVVSRRKARPPRRVFFREEGGRAGALPQEQKGLRLLSDLAVRRGGRKDAHFRQERTIFALAIGRRMCYTPGTPRRRVPLPRAAIFRGGIPQ